MYRKFVRVYCILKIEDNIILVVTRVLRDRFKDLRRVNLLREVFRDEIFLL